MPSRGGRTTPGIRDESESSHRSKDDECMYCGEKEELTVNQIFSSPTGGECIPAHGCDAILPTWFPNLARRSRIVCNRCKREYNIIMNPIDIAALLDSLGYSDNLGDPMNNLNLEIESIRGGFKGITVPLNPRITSRKGKNIHIIFCKDNENFMLSCYLHDGVIEATDVAKVARS